MERTIRVTINGREYPLRTSEEDEAFTRRIAGLVDQRMRESARQAPGHPDLTHAVLAGLTLSEELLHARDELDRLRSALNDAAGLADRLDAVLESPAAGDGASQLPATPSRRKSAQDREKDLLRSDPVSNEANADSGDDASEEPPMADSSAESA